MLELEPFIRFVSYRVSMLFMLLFIITFSPRKKNGSSPWVIASTVFIMTWIIDYIYFFTDFHGNIMYNTIFQVLIVLVATISICRYKDQRALFIGLCSADYVLIGNTLFSIAMANNQPPFFAIGMEFATHLLVLIGLRQIGLHRRCKVEMEYGTNRWMFACTVPAIFFAAVFSMSVYPINVYDVPEVSTSLIIIMLLMFITFTIMIELISRNRAEVELERETQTLETYTKGIIRESNNTNRIKEEIAIIRHDLRHQYRMIDACLESGDYERIRGIVNEQYEKLEATKQKSFCENTMINGILSIFSAKAEEMGVAFNCMADVPEDEKLGYDFEFATMLSNLIDNAINAASSVKHGPRLVVVKLQPLKEQLMVEVKNYSETELEFSPETGLPLSHGGEGHGYGLKSVNAYANQHNAIFQIFQEDDMVVSRYITNK